MWELDYKENWPLKNWCFWTVVLEKTLESPLASKETQPVNPKGNQSWIFSFSWNSRKLQYFGHLMRRTDSLENTLMLGMLEGRRRRGQQRMRWLNSITDSLTLVWVNSVFWWWTWRLGMTQSTGSQKVKHKWATELNWSTGEKIIKKKYTFNLNNHRRILLTI